MTTIINIAAAVRVRMLLICVVTSVMFAIITPLPEMMDSRPRRLVAALFPALFAPLQLLLFGPFTIYIGNEAEFSAPFWTLALHLMPMILGMAAVLMLVALVLPAALWRGYIVGLVAIGIVGWIQGNLIVGDYGPINARDIEWSTHAWRNRHELPLWIGLPVLAVIARRKVYPAAVFASRVFIALQCVLIGFTAAQAGPEPRPKWEGAPDAIFAISSQQNVFHLVLDSFQSDVFHEIIELDRAAIDRRFSGFTFFANHAGAFSTTIVSIPAMLTGRVYRNEEPMRRYINKQFRRASLFGAMREQGYQVDAVSWLTYDKASATNYYKMPTPYVTYDAYSRFAAWQLADLSLFRHSPHVLKPAIFNGQAWRLQTIFGETLNTQSRRYLPVNGEAFLNDFTHRIRVSHDRPTYKFLHVGVPHWPTVLTADCEFAGVRPMTRELYTDQARCAITRVGEFLDKLRALGLYDSSLIVISSDHGMGIPPRGFIGDRHLFDGPLSMVTGAAAALLLVKAPLAEGPLRISGAPTTIGDIPATIVDAMGLTNPFPGIPALKLDEQKPRVRSFAIYPWHDTGWTSDYFRLMDVFSIDGWLLDGNTWKFEEPLYSPNIDPADRIRGFHRLERDDHGMLFRWSRPIAYLHAPPAARGVELTVRSTATTPQTATIEIAGNVVDRITFSDRAWRTLRYPIGRPAARAGNAGTWIVLRISPEWRPPDDTRIVGVMTRGLKWLQ
jgi:hypothetical protein